MTTPETLVIVDTKNLCYRARYSTGGLSFRDNPTGVSFGFLKEIRRVDDLLNPTHWAFAFDSASSANKRRKLYPRYKESRRHKEMDEDERAEHDAFYAQIADLRDRILPEMGYRNVFEAPGYEADDIVASIAQVAASTTQVYIVSSDADFFQCLRQNVSMYIPAKGKKPARIYTIGKFRAEHNLMPIQWAMVKAIAGCKSDDVEGVSGVGEVYAARWIRNELKLSSKAYVSIDKGIGTIARNLPLVTLPFEGTPVFDLVDDEVTERKIRQVEASIGIRSQPAHRHAGTRVGGFDV